MQYHKLGTSDLNVSKICLGTMTFGQQNSEKEAHEQLDYSVSQGINFIDTAEMYSVPCKAETHGSTERFIGTWLAKRSDRDQLIIATKIVGPNPNLTFIRNPLNFSNESIDTAIDGSLKRLQTDYVDIYQLHWPERSANYFGKLGYEHSPEDIWEDNFLEVITKLNDLIKEGKIRHWGLSNETAWGVMRCLQLAEKHNLPKPLTIQNPYGLLNRSYEVGLAEVSIRENVPLLAYSPLGFGVLSGKYRSGDVPKNSRLDLFPRFARYNGEPTRDAAELYFQIADKYKFSPVHLALAYVTSRPFLGANIIGATTMDQLKENIASINLDLTDEIISELDDVQKAISNPAP